MSFKTDRCVLCLEQKRSPVHIVCGHSFCCECLNVYKTYHKYSWASRCPICRGVLKEKRSRVRRRTIERSYRSIPRTISSQAVRAIGAAVTQPSQSVYNIRQVATPSVARTSTTAPSESASLPSNNHENTTYMSRSNIDVNNGNSSLRHIVLQRYVTIADDAAPDGRVAVIPPTNAQIETVQALIANAESYENANNSDIDNHMVESVGNDAVGNDAGGINIGASDIIYYNVRNPDNGRENIYVVEDVMFENSTAEENSAVENAEVIIDDYATEENTDEAQGDGDGDGGGGSDNIGDINGGDVEDDSNDDDEDSTYYFYESDYGDSMEMDFSMDASPAVATPNANEDVQVDETQFELLQESQGRWPLPLEVEVDWDEDEDEYENAAADTNGGANGNGESLLMMAQAPQQLSNPDSQIIQLVDGDLNNDHNVARLLNYVIYFDSNTC